MKIGVDLDDVLVDFWSEMLTFHNSRYGTAFSKGDFFSYDMWEVLGITREEGIARIETFYASPQFTAIPALPGAQEAVRAMGERHELIVITGRPEYTALATHELINRHFPDAFADIHFTNAYARGLPPRAKADVCREQEIELLLEDHIGHALGAAEAGISVMLFDQPWNTEAPEHENMTRVLSWRDVREALMV